VGGVKRLHSTDHASITGWGEGNSESVKEVRQRSG